MEPVSDRWRKEGEDFDRENAVLDHKYSDGAVEALFSAKLQDEQEFQGWLQVTREEATALLRSVVEETKPGWPPRRVEQEVERLQEILGRALFFRIKMDICHRASRALQRTASDLRAIAGDDGKLRALMEELKKFPDGSQCLEDIYGRTWDGYFSPLRQAVLDRARSLDKLAEGLHVKDVLHKEDPLREFPELLRLAYRMLPEGSFAREVFPEHLQRYQLQRETERDALDIWKGVCGAAAVFASGGAAAPLLKLNGIVNAWGEVLAGRTNFRRATEWAYAARLSGGAGSEDFQAAISRRNLRGVLDGVGVVVSLSALMAGKALPDLQKALIKIDTSLLKAAAEGAPRLGADGGGPERLDQIIHRLAGS